MASVELVRVYKRYGTAEACAGVDLSINDGEFVTLLGPSGCGKSTTLNLIAGLDDVTSGDILMDGQRVNELIPFQRDVAMVFQQYALYPQMTVAENIGFTLRLRKTPRSEVQAQVQQVAELLELTPYLDRLPRELSGGQQQRVAIGRAVIRSPRLFLFDEPFSNLDAALRVRMRGEVKDLHQRLGTTSIFVTHDQEEAMSISDRIAVMRDGKVEQFGSPQEIYGHPVSKYVAEFVGSPGMCFFRGHLADDPAGLRLDGPQLSLPLTGISLPASMRIGDEVELGVRSEHVRLDADGVPARVRIVQPIGPETHVSLGWDDSSGTIAARVPGISQLQPGDLVTVSIDPAGVHWFNLGTGDRISDR